MSFSGVIQAIHPMKGHAIWLYDATYPSGPEDKPENQPGYWVDWLNEYNQNTAEEHQIKTLFFYGGNVEIYGRGAGESSPEIPIDPSNVFVYYDFDSRMAAELYKDVIGVQNLLPVVDGRIDSWLLWPLNPNLDHVGEIVAQKMTECYLNDGKLKGIQIDLEPFNISSSGQFTMYRKLKELFEGKEQRNRAFYSNFFFPSKLSDSEWQLMQEAFGKQSFVIVSGYDLGKGEAGLAHSPEHYSLAFQKEVEIMMQKASEHDLYFMVGIPVSASTYEFEVSTKDGVIDTMSGYRQIDYIKAAFEVIERLKLREHPHFLGFSLWGLSTSMSYPPHTNNLYYPSEPQEEMIKFLQNNL